MMFAVQLVSSSGSYAVSESLESDARDTVAKEMKINDSIFVKLS